MTLGMWLSLAGGFLELAAVAIASVAAWRGYKKVRTKVGILRKSLEQYKAQTVTGADAKAASAEMAAYRQQHGIEPDAKWDDVLYMKTVITYLVSRAAARSAALTVGFLSAGIFLTTWGDLLSR